MADSSPLVAPTSRRQLARFLGAGAALAAVAPLLRAQVSSAPAAAAETTPSSPPNPAAPPTPVRLDSNENPYGPPPASIAAIGTTLALSARYPDAEIDALEAALAVAHGVPNDSVTLGAGSSQILHAAANAFSGPTLRCVTATPTFESLGRYAEARGAEVVRVPLTANHRHALQAMAAAAGSKALVYLCNPNNPTGSVTPAEEIRRFLESVPPEVVVLVDEAYHEYAVGEAGYESVVPWLARFPNLVVARTFSKVYGLAGLRCGYALAAPERIAALRKQLPYDSMSLAGLVAAKAALGDTPHIKRSLDGNRALRTQVTSALSALGAKVVPSAANFLFADLGRDVGPVIEALKAREVHVGRRFAPMPTHLRVTIGTDAEMRAFLAAFGEVYSAAKAA